MLTIKKIDSVACIEIKGRIDTLTSADFDKLISPLIDKEQFMVIDFAKCVYLSSFGIRSLINASKKLHAKDDGRLILCNLSAEVNQVLEMAGLDKIFAITDSVEKAVQTINHLKEKPLAATELTICGCHTRLQTTGEPFQIARIWKEPGIAGYDELEIAFGTGISAEMMNQKGKTIDFFITTGNCAAFFPAEQSFPPDFRIIQQPTQAGILVKDAISFMPNAGAVMQISSTGGISIQKTQQIIQETINTLQAQIQILAAVIVNRNPTAISVSLSLIGDQADSKKFAIESKPLSGSPKKHEGKPSFAGTKFLLSRLIEHESIRTLREFLDKHLTFENIMDVESLNEDDLFVNPLIWLLIADKKEDAAKNRIQIIADNVFLSESSKYMTKIYKYL
jgi:anti-sigma B factor antagonist